VIRIAKNLYSSLKNFIGGFELHKSYRYSGKLLKTSDSQQSTVYKYKEIKDYKELSSSLLSNANFVLQYLNQNISPLTNGSNTPAKTEKYKDIVKMMETIQKDVSKIGFKYDIHQKEIDKISDFRDSFSSLDTKFREHVELEAFNKAIDIKHKLNLTALRVFQIPVFILVTYVSVASAVILLDKFNIKGDLIIPRGLISIVPSTLEQNAQKMAKFQEKSDNTSSEISATP